MKPLRIKKDVPYYMDDDDRSGFEAWMARIDNLFWRFAGLSVHDMPDCQFMDWYEERIRPVYAVNHVLENA